MTDFSEARNRYCKVCHSWFCPEDGGCNCENWKGDIEENDFTEREEYAKPLVSMFRRTNYRD